MKRNLLAGMIAAISASGALAGEAVFYVTEQGKPVDTLSITVDGERQLIGKNGVVSFDLKGGTHQVEFSEFGQWAGEFEFDAASEQNAEIKVEMIGGEAVPDISVYTPGQQEGAVLGQVSGYIESDETGGGVEGARISIEGSDVATQTDGEGYYELELPRGEYDLRIAHPSYGNRDVKGIRVFGNSATAMNINMSLSGDSSIEEVVALGSYIPSTVTSQQRDASGVLDAIGAEQFSRFGDSNAASALKRVSGVTINGGKYAVVRGLNERYTSVLFNGAMLPSPDPTRRVVPLDIFPSAVISSINVEKTGSANRPSDSAGATIDLISKEAPTEFEGKLKISGGYVDGTTFEDGTVQKTSGLEVLGFTSSGRKLSSGSKGYKYQEQTTSLSGSEAANALDLAQWETEEVTINPDIGVELSVGDLIDSYSFGDLSYKATARYSNKWDLKEIDRANYISIDPSKGIFEESEEYVETRVTNNIDLSGAVALSLTGADYSVTSNTMLLRNTQQDSVQNKGIMDEQRQFTVEKSYTWQEREFFMQQFIGEQLYPQFLDTQINWGVTYSNAQLNSPDSRSYSLNVPGSDRDQAVNNEFDPLLNDRSDELELLTTVRPQRDFLELEDEALDFQVAASMLLISDDAYDFKLSAGLSSMERDRTVEADTFVYELVGELSQDLASEQDISNVLTPSLFDETSAGLTVKPDYNASYTGKWELTSFYMMPELNLFDVFKVQAGVRMEESTLTVTTLPNPDTNESSKVEVSDDNIYPSANLTVTAIEDVQLRLSYYESVNRPDFREISSSQFKDSVTGDSYIGNPNLSEAEVSNIDARIEYYFSDNESISFGVFSKEIANAIERTTDVIAGSGNRVIYGFDNGGDATAEGIEISASKDFDFERYGLRITANASVFDTEVEEINASGFLLRKRALQGQPELLANIQVALDDYETERELTFVFNHTGESLFAVPSNDNLADEMLLARNVLDIRFKQSFNETMSLSASLENVLDEEIEQQQGGKLTKRYSPGREINVSFGYEF